MFTAIAITAVTVFTVVRGYYHREITVGRAFLKYVNEKMDQDLQKAESLIKAGVEKVKTEVKAVEDEVKKAL